MDRPLVEDGVGRVQAQAVDVEIAQPIQGVLDEKLPHARAARTVVVDGLAPGRAVAVGEVRPEIAQVVSFGPQVVVDHVEDHGEPCAVAGVDEARQPGRAAVGQACGKGKDAVVAPVAPARELGHGHELEAGDAERAQMRQSFDDGVERALRRERADVDFVIDAPVRGRRHERGVGPGEGVGIDQGRGAVDVIRLVARGWIGAARPAVQHEPIARSFRQTRDFRRVIAARQRFHGHCDACGVEKQSKACAVGRPDGEAPGGGAGFLRADRQRPREHSLHTFLYAPKPGQGQTAIRLRRADVVTPWRRAGAPVRRGRRPWGRGGRRQGTAPARSPGVRPA